eukprot:3885621-Amphidinium_carterae.1
MALLVVPGGFGEVYAKQLPCTCECIVGATRGEAGVDCLLIDDLSFVVSLRNTSLPIVATMALLEYKSDVELESLAAVVEYSENWSRVFSFVQAWRGEHPRDNGHETTFRVTALRDDALKDPKVNTIAGAAAAGVSRKFSWTVNLRAFDWEVLVIWLVKRTIIAVPLTDGWTACTKAGFFPMDQSSTVCGTQELQPTRRSVCHGLLLLANVSSGDVVLDPMAGVGAIPAEAVRSWRGTTVLAGERNSSAVRQARRTARRCAEHLCRTFEAFRWDASRLPLRSQSVDCLVTDFPWGNRSRLDASLLERVVRESARVLAATGCAVFLLLRPMAKQLHEMSRALSVVRSLDVIVGGWP